jgi:leucyl/phenylalanyl-tRNA--protein transferase
MALEIVFPNPEEAEDDGLVAVGGNLSSDFLIAAYSQGVFPWFNEGEPILWWSPNPRMVLFPSDFKCSKSLQQVIRSNKFEVKIDTVFNQVINYCSQVKREGQVGTWITEGIKKAYNELHQQGLAHSFETWQDGKLVGGLYGVSLGKSFFGESMFHLVNDASKIALYNLVQLMKKWNYDLIDVQQSTNHLKSMGARDIARKDFLIILKKSLEGPTKKGKWGIDERQFDNFNYSTIKKM